MGLTEEAWEDQIKRRRSAYISDPLELYSERYFRRRQRGMRDKEIKAGEILSNLFNIESMVDFGCGLGSYLEGVLKGKTEKVLGIDICYDRLIKYVPEQMQKFIIWGDAGKELDVGKWDCVFSLETAEHLLPETANTFVDNMVNASSRLIVFRAAMSFSKWHLNPGKPREYWLEKFADRGCKELFNEEEKLAKAWRGCVIKYIRRTLMILEI